MEMQVAVKVKLNLANADIASSFTNTMEQYRLACNYVSGYIFNHNFDMKQSRLTKFCILIYVVYLCLNHKWLNL